MAEPRIYTKNYISADDTFTLSHGSATKAYLYDRDTLSKWLTSGANSDATQVTIQADFYEGATPITRAITALFLLNTNFKTWNFDYWNGSAWVTLSSGTTDSTANLIKTFGSVSTTKVRLQVTATQTTNAEKFIGEWIVCALTLDIGRDMTDYDPTWRQKEKTLALGDGSIHRAYVRHTPNRSGKYEARVRLKYLAAATLASLQTIKEAGVPFLWYPESAERTDELWYVHWSNPWKAKYSSDYKGAGWDLDLDLKEV